MLIGHKTATTRAKTSPRGSTSNPIVIPGASRVTDSPATSLYKAKRSVSSATQTSVMNGTTTATIRYPPRRRLAVSNAQKKGETNAICSMVSLNAVYSPKMSRDACIAAPTRSAESIPM